MNKFYPNHEEKHQNLFVHLFEIKQEWKPKRRDQLKNFKNQLKKQDSLMKIFLEDFQPLIDEFLLS